MLVCLLITLLVSFSCQTDTFRRPIVPQCISNGDGTSECSYQGREYTESNNMNYVCTPPESFGKYQAYVLELEERLLKCENGN